MFMACLLRRLDGISTHYAPGEDIHPLVCDAGIPLFLEERKTWALRSRTKDHISS